MWKTICDIKKTTDSARAQAAKLLTCYREKGYLPLSPSEALDISDEIISEFYFLLSENASPYISPPDSSWMISSSFCFINVRATGKKSGHGNFLSAAKILPTLRSDAIHLGPFTEYSFQVIYSITSVKSISDFVVDAKLESEGFFREHQLRAFVFAAHLLGKKVGFDIEPHLARYSVPVLENPDMFIWIRLDEKKNLISGMSFDEMMSEENQNDISSYVRSLVSGIMNESGIRTFDDEEGESSEQRARKRRLFYRTISEVIAAGCWPVNPQVWNGHGLPAFAGYNHEGNHPESEFRDRHGNICNDGVHRLLTPIAFYRGYKANTLAPFSDLRKNEKAELFFFSIFKYWRDNFGFDFVRYDSMDHIFDSLWNGSYEVPASDRISPDALKRSVQSFTSNNPHVGTLAERMGTNFEEYAGCGFDLILGNDMMRRVDSVLMNDMLAMQRRLESFNLGREKKSSVCFAVDTHDTGDPNLWGRPLVEVMGFDRMLLRNFVSLFFSCGLGLRPRYESIGCQDLSHGLYYSNINDANMNWVGNRDFNRLYHVMSDIRESLSEIFRCGEMFSFHVDERKAWWVIRCGKDVLAAVISLECMEECEYIDEVKISIPFKSAECNSYDFYDGTQKSVPCENGSIAINNVRYLGYALVAARET